ncbi:MAG: PHP domain-containing protein [Bacilli bacterium]|nr:PHP domain-containing protein [Bacilli bacterium]
MNKVEVHAKTKYSFDYESTIDVETIIMDSLENNEKGIIFIDKDTNYSFYKIENIYKELCNKDDRFKKYKIGYGVEITTIIDNKEYEINLILKNNDGVYNLNKILDIYTNIYNKKIPLDEIINLRNNLIIGFILNDEDIDIDLSIFDYIEINKKLDIDFKNKLVVYSNVPNALNSDELLAKKVINYYRHIKTNPEIRCYMDTLETLKIFNDEKIVINNSNKLLNMIDYIDTNHDFNYKGNYDYLEKLVYEKFKEKYKNPSEKTINRLKEELSLIKELNYTYFYEMLINITNFLKDNNEYYEIDDYINNSLVAFVLGITNIDPYNLPYELFFSKIPNLVLKVNDNFYFKKLFFYMVENYNLVKCNYGHKVNIQDAYRIIRHYEILNKIKLSNNDKELIAKYIIDIPVYNDTLYNSFLVIPDNYLNYTALNNHGTLIDYHDLSDMIKINILPNENIKDIDKHKFYNNIDVLNVLREGEDLSDISNLNMDELVKAYADKYHMVILDDVYNKLKDIIDEVSIYLVINSLDMNFIPKANIINKIRNLYLYYERINNGSKNN